MSLQERINNMILRDKSKRDCYQRKVDRQQGYVDRLNTELKILEKSDLLEDLQKKFDICLAEVKEIGIIIIDSFDINTNSFVTAEYKKGEVNISGHIYCEVDPTEARVAINFRPNIVYGDIVRVSMGERLFKKVEIIQYLMKKAGGK